MNAYKDFPSKVVNALAAKDIEIIGSTWVPDAKGDFANGETAYKLNDNGCMRIRTYRDVYKMAGVEFK